MRSFSLRYTKEDIPALPALLRGVSKKKLCEMQTNLAKYYRALLWDKPVCIYIYMFIYVCIYIYKCVSIYIHICVYSSARCRTTWLSITARCFGTSR